MTFAKTRDGFMMPVIDVAHPRFAIDDRPETIAERRAAFIAWDRKRRWMPQFLQRLFFRQAAKRSRLVKAMFQSNTGFLDSITTYVLKLGVNNLPEGFDSPIDRQIAGAPHVTFIRLRMQQVATLLAEALAEPLKDGPAAPLHLINIAGGPALDSLNALILLERDHRDLLKRKAVIHVLDAQLDGPIFGANALKALQADGAPLQGLAIEFRQQPYDWNDTASLRRLATELVAQGAIVAASSEGGLFEYGGDDAIVANLKALSDSGVVHVAGSVTTNSELRKRMIAQTTFKLHPRGLEGFAPLAAAGGYVIAGHRPAIMSDQVLLTLRQS